jgi:hypothetical protein
MALQNGINELPIFNYFDRQRFLQFSPQDAANWNIEQAPSGKKKFALYPTMGRRHVTTFNMNRLIFNDEPSAIFRSIDFVYVIVGDTVWQVDQYYNQYEISIPSFQIGSGIFSFDYLPVVQAPAFPAKPYQAVFCMLTNGQTIYVIDELTKTMTVVTDTNAPVNPTAVAAFGNRFVVASLNSTQFNLSQINLGGVYSPSTCFTIAGSAVFAQEAGLIREFGVLHNQLYIFCDFTTGIWSNTPSVFTSATVTSSFPWKKNSSYDWDYGIADVASLDIDFGRMTWLAKNKNGLIQFMQSSGQLPESISTKAVNVLLQNSTSPTQENPWTLNTVEGFLYQYEDTIFYRASVLITETDGNITIDDSAFSIEYNFDTKTWHRCIEVDGSRNKIRKHVYFNNAHLVTVQGESTLYEMAGNFYYNELRNKLETNPQATDAYTQFPFRYENVTPIICEDDYSEFITDYLEIDFVFGKDTFIFWQGPFNTTVFVVGETSTLTNPIYMVSEDGLSYIVQDGTDIPIESSTTYNALFKPHIELYYSDDGGINFHSADVREFSQLGVYQWKMRWYELGASRNRVYKLIAVSPSPIVILGGTMNIRRASGGAN